MEKPPKNMKGVTTILVNRVWEVAGGMVKRPGKHYEMITIDDVPPKIRWTKNGKGILYQVK